MINKFIPVLLEMGIEGGVLFLITRIPSLTDKFTGSHLLLTVLEQTHYIVTHLEHDMHAQQ